MPRRRRVETLGLFLVAVALVAVALVVYWLLPGTGLLRGLLVLVIVAVAGTVVLVYIFRVEKSFWVGVAQALVTGLVLSVAAFILDQVVKDAIQVQARVDRNAATVELINRGTQTRFRTLDLTDINLEYLSMAQYDFSYAQLVDANLQGAILTGADLTGADLTGADLTGADLTGAVVTVEQLDTTRSLAGATCPNGEAAEDDKCSGVDPIASTQPANLAGASLVGQDLTGRLLAGANLAGADLTGANLGGVDLEGANLAGADLTGAILENADLDDANLERAVVTAAQLTSAGSLKGAICPDGSTCAGPPGPGADLRGADLSGSDLRGAELRGADLAGVDLAGADLAESDLRGAELRGANLAGADLTGALGADLESAILDDHTVCPRGARATAGSCDATPNSPPQAIDDTRTVRSGQTILIDVLANDHDADGDELLVESVGMASYGDPEVEPSSQSILYEHRGGTTPPDSFRYRVSDGANDGVGATVSIVLVHEIQPDDTLWRLALRALQAVGEPACSNQIAAYAVQLWASNLRAIGADPDALRVGRLLRIEQYVPPARPLCPARS